MSSLFILVELFLSQLAVYNRIKETVMNSPDINFVNSLEKKTFGKSNDSCSNPCQSCKKIDDVQIKFTFERNGPALTAIAKNKKDSVEIIHVDFTFGLFCRRFPTDFQGLFYLINIFKFT